MAQTQHKATLWLAKWGERYNLIPEIFLQTHLCFPSKSCWSHCPSHAWILQRPLCGVEGCWPSPFPLLRLDPATHSLRPFLSGLLTLACPGGLVHFVWGRHVPCWVRDLTLLWAEDYSVFKNKEKGDLFGNSKMYKYMIDYKIRKEKKVECKTSIFFN